MKSTLGIFCCILAVINAQGITSPKLLFQHALETQESINVLQADIFAKITNIRVALSSVLKKTANNTLGDIELDANTVLAADTDLRNKLYSYPNSYCFENLKYRLTYESEWTGYISGICIRNFDTEVTVIVDDAFAEIAVYDNELSKFELSVIEAFRARNVWTEQDSIESAFTSSYKDFQNKLETLWGKVKDLSANVDAKIGDQRAILKECYGVSEENHKEQAKRIEEQIKSCVDFDSK